MEAPKLGKFRTSERDIQDNIIRFLTLKGWFVKETHGNMFQKGFPDLWATHTKYGARWIEVKCPDGYSFTAAQLEDFPKICAFGSGVWIMTSASEEQYQCLFRRFNWVSYLLALGQKGCAR